MPERLPGETQEEVKKSHTKVEWSIELRRNCSKSRLPFSEQVKDLEQVGICASLEQGLRKTRWGVHFFYNWHDTYLWQQDRDWLNQWKESKYAERYMYVWNTVKPAEDRAQSVGTYVETCSQVHRRNWQAHKGNVKTCPQAHWRSLHTHYTRNKLCGASLKFLHEILTLFIRGPFSGTKPFYAPLKTCLKFAYYSHTKAHAKKEDARANYILLKGHELLSSKIT